MEDRLYAIALITNGSESNWAAGQMDDLPGVNCGVWYDFGGTWIEDKKAWQLFGDSTADNDWHRDLVVRVGAGANFAPMDTRVIYGDEEQSRFARAPAGRESSTSSTAMRLGTAYAVDRFNATTLNAFIAGKWHGWSFDNEYFAKCLDNFQGVTGHPILYTNSIGGGANASLLNVDSMTDYGMILQGGYFLIPTKLEILARWSAVFGESGSLNGDGTYTTTTVGGKSVQVVNNAFRIYNTANEYTIGLNWYFRGHLLKWQSDVGYYQGGNPANASAAGFVTNSDGILARTQLQLAF